MYQQKAVSIRFVCIIIAVAVDKINKMADCRFSRIEGKQREVVVFVFE